MLYLFIRHKTSHMVLSIIFLEDKHTILLHLSILYEYQQFFQHRICFSIQPQLQLVKLHRNAVSPKFLVQSLILDLQIHIKYIAAIFKQPY
jgi:hypothetical protein